MRKVYLSPSQQFYNMYATGNTSEGIQCNKIAEYTERYLKEHSGIEVKRAPSKQDMNTSIKESNAWGADLHIPIHTNAGGGNGTLIMIYNNDSPNQKLAQSIFNRLTPVCPGTKNDAIKVNSTLAELNSTKATAAYIECDFHDNKEIAQFIIDNTELIGKTIAHGICDYLGIEFNPIMGDSLYYVQTGAFKNRANAEQLVEKLQQMGFSAIIKN